MKYFNDQIITTTLLKDQAVTTAKVADKAVTRAKLDDSLTPKWVNGGLMTHFHDDTTPGAGTAKGVVKNVSVTGTFDWSTPSPNGFGGVSTNITMRAFGGIRLPAEGTWTFYITTDDGTRLYVSQTLVVNSWISQGSTTYSGTITINPGESKFRRISLNWFQGTGGSQLKLEWENVAAGYARAVVPASALYYETPIWWPLGVAATAGTVGVPASVFQGTWLPYNYDYPPMWRIVGGYAEMTGLIVPGVAGNAILFDPQYTNTSAFETLFNQVSANPAYGFSDVRITGRILTVPNFPASTLWINLQGVRWPVPFVDLA